MKLISSVSGNREYFAPLRQVFKKSLKDTMPNLPYTILELEFIKETSHRTVANGKAALQVMDYLLTQPEGLYAVADIDLIFLRSIEDIKKEDFTAAFTIRQSASRYNTGLWFIRFPEGRDFLKTWRDILQDEIKNFEVKGKWRLWAGIVQSSLALTVKQRPEYILELPCVEWNACQGEWHLTDENTRVIHLKSGLREQVLGNKEADPQLLGFINKARGYIQWE